MADIAALLGLPGSDAAAPADIPSLISSGAHAIGVPESIAMALARRESSLNPRAESPDNGRGRGTAKGVYQLLDSTAADHGVTDSFDPVQNIQAGLTNLKSNYDRFGSWEMALAAHHAGAGAVERAGGIPEGGDMNTSTADYVNSIMQDAGPESAPAAASAPSFLDRLEVAHGAAKPAPGKITVGDIGHGLQDSLAYSAYSTVQGLKAMWADATGDTDGMDEAKRNILSANELHAQNQPQFANKLAGMLYSGASGLATAAPILAVGALNPVAGAAAFGAQGGAEAYGKYRARGGSAGEAALGGTLEGGIMAAAGYLPLGFLAEKMGKVGMGEFVSGMLARDVPTMVAQGIATDLVDTSIANPHRTLKDFISDLPENAMQSAVSALVFAAGTGAAHGIARKIKGTAETAPPGTVPPAGEGELPPLTAPDLSLVPKGEEQTAARDEGAVPPEDPDLELDPIISNALGRAADVRRMFNFPEGGRVPEEAKAPDASGILNAGSVDEAIAAAQAATPKLELPSGDSTGVDREAAAQVADAITPPAPPKRVRLLTDGGLNAGDTPWHHDYEAVKHPDGSVTLERTVTTPEGIRTEVRGKDGTWGVDAEPMTFRSVKFATEEAAAAKAEPKTNPLVDAALPEFNDIEPPKIYSVQPEERQAIIDAAVNRTLYRANGYENVPARRESVGLTVDRHLRALDQGKITPDEFVQRMDELNIRMQQRDAEAKAQPGQPRERGADYIRERILQAKRRGDITEDAANMAEWFVQKNPALLDDLGISVRSPGENGTAGSYMPGERIIAIMKGGDKSTVAVHEILHHLERMMPEDMQKDVHTEYLRRIADEIKNKDPAMTEYLTNVLRGDRKSIEAAAEMVKTGKVPYEAYQYMNPSEFWAVSMTRVMEGRYRAGETGLWARTRQWLKEALEHIKGALKLSSDAPMLRALNDLIAHGDGTFRSKRMLSEGSVFRDIAEPKESIYSRVDPRRIIHGYSPYVGVEMARLPSGAFGDAVVRAFAPGARGSGKEAGGIIRGNSGEQARERELAMTKLQGFAAMFDKFSPEDNFKFIDDMEHGRTIDNPRLAEAAGALRKTMDKYREKVQLLGKGKLENFNENYFPHIYKDPEQAASFFRSVLSKRSLEGGKGFLKKRTYDYLADAIKSKDEGGGGLTPITDNPVEMVLLKLREMDRYVYGQRIFTELKAAGLVSFVRASHDIPEGWVKINDKIASVNSPAAEGGLIHRGDYYAPEEAATVINNHLSPGLSGNGFYDAFRGVGNAMNSMQLSLSLFHLGFTTMDALVSKNALAAMQLRRGDVAGGLGSLFMGTVGAPVAPIINFRNGNRLLKAYRGETSDPALAPLVEALQHAGAKTRDDLYRNVTVNAFKQALRAGRYGEAAVKLLPTILDYMNKPIFEYLVPRQKFGVFFDLAKDAIKANPNMMLEQKRATFGKLWDSVDNRMGELVYDNVFWNRALKDGLMAVTRSVGWNLGTYRELGGGVKDLPGFITGKDVSPRTAYIVALPFTAAILGSVMQYLYTGQGPQDLKDAFFPRDGGTDTDGVTPTRKSLPSYVKDVASYYEDVKNFAEYGGDPTRTIKNKTAPLISTIGQMLSNKDFLGGAIRSPGDPAVQQAADVAAYLTKQMIPFSVRNYQQGVQAKSGQGSLLDYITSGAFYGLAPAPREITQTPEQQESMMAFGMKDSLIKKFRQDIRENGVQDDTMQRMVDAGLTPQERHMILRGSTGAPHSFKPRAFGGGQ